MLLKVDNLKTHFPLKKGILHKDKEVIRAVDGVSLHLAKNEVLGVVGESGCGKSTLGKTLLRLIEPTAGGIFLEDENITNLPFKKLRPLRKKMQIIFQDPISSLNPRMTILDAICEPLQIHTKLSAREQEREASRLLDVVGVASSARDRFPHQFSGGQCQRIAIARSLALKPQLIVADEPVSALDVSIQAQILNLMEDLKEEMGLSYLFISHDLAVVNHIADRIMVMYLGEVVEEGDATDIVTNPKHPYTEALISAIPVPVVGKKQSPQLLTGAIPSPANPPTGCRFHTRCPKAIEQCKQQKPALRKLDGRTVRCDLI